jgi:uncharacterized membrane protein
MIQMTQKTHQIRHKNNNKTIKIQINQFRMLSNCT